MKDNMQNRVGCTLCPRECKIDRKAGNIGVCGCDDTLMVSRAALHMWEEPCISGDEGSGTVFFSGCPLKCIFCQNSDISGGAAGKKISVERLAEIFIEQQNRGANNINLVTPTHYATQIVKALGLVGQKNLLHIPVVYNTGGYEKVETLKKLEGYVDVYLPDFKYFDANLANKYSKAADYPDVAKAALAEMFRQVGKPQFDDRGIMTKGIIVRHLVLPGNIEDSKKVIKYLYETYGDDIYLSIMSQYTPMKAFEPGGKLHDTYPELSRKLTANEYDEVVDYAIELGVENAFIQEGDVALESFIPAFDCEGV